MTKVCAYNFPHKESNVQCPRIASEIHSKKRQRQEMLDALPLACNVKQPAPALTTSEGEPMDTTLIIKEKPNSPPVLPLIQSISAQCFPSKADAATQTIADAAAQWPVDRHYPVTADHIYAGKHQIELDKVLTLEEDSQPQDRQSDPDCNVSSSELSQSTQESQASTDTHK